MFQQPLAAAFLPQPTNRELFPMGVSNQDLREITTLLCTTSLFGGSLPTRPQSGTGYSLIPVDSAPLASAPSANRTKLRSDTNLGRRATAEQSTLNTGRVTKEMDGTLNAKMIWSLSLLRCCDSNSNYCR